ncbi:hypothetical protein LSTR_LSTR004743 [Laodelphax striatellus]|uniref:Uncharacterized protein n=1 Tax=Laodelphax striatellus TaxID=195883 RepID=A0A482XKG0_LAOST|nr:hypothetical protein LSTR_LSTR004743 [Laodelphax striatellus]
MRRLLASRWGWLGVARGLRGRFGRREPAVDSETRPRTEHIARCTTSLSSDSSVFYVVARAAAAGDVQPSMTVAYLLPLGGRVEKELSRGGQLT